ncbi:MAG: sulfotransferase [Alphaproteobacteria bacterium]|nr:MAG: sulfotransferase [Alphaproteobacteria bacterium]
MTLQRSLPIPNFFIVGAPKCATTAMDRYLSEHPEIYMSPVKECNFFARDLYPSGVACSEEYYAGLFKDAGDEPVVGESSVFYMLSSEAAKAIHDHNPDARILIMLRDPVEVVASHHSQIVYETFETEKSLERALALEPERRKQFEGQALKVSQRVLLYRDIVKFSEQIERFLKVFPREQVHIVLYDDVKKDLPGVYRGILEFLGVDPDFKPSFVVENANKKMRSERFGKFLRQTPDWVSRLSRVILPRRSWRVKLREKLKRLNTRFTKRDPIPEQVRVSLATELWPEVEKLEKLLGRDLGHWCANRHR